MEYASRGDLYDYICDKRSISERDTRSFFRQIVSAVHYCHQVGQSLIIQSFYTEHIVFFYRRCNHGTLESSFEKQNVGILSISVPIMRGCYSTLKLMTQSPTQTSCFAHCFFPGQRHLQSYIMGIIQCAPADLHREAVRTMQGEMNSLSAES